MTLRDHRGLVATAALLAAVLAAPLARAAVTTFQVQNLVADSPTSATAAHYDPNLINPWGVSFAPGTPFWVSDNGAGAATLYTGSGASFAPLPKVAMPAVAPNPTGQVFNTGFATGKFTIGGNPTDFLFAGEDGHISGWGTAGFGTTAQVGFTTSADAVFKGLAIASSGPDTKLFAADFHNNAVDVFTNDFGAFTSFTDPTVQAGYAPFNAQVLDGLLYVTFAKQDADAEDDVAGAGNGYVDAFNLDGTLNHRVASVGDQINSPWGLAIAPSTFGAFADKLLVGNFGDGTISVFDPAGGFLGKLSGFDGQPLHEGDLWALTPGSGAMGFDPNKIYFTAGLVDESEGLFGVISTTPEPGAWILLIAGFGLAGAALRSRRRAAQPA